MEVIWALVRRSVGFFSYEGHRLVYTDWGSGDRPLALLPGLILPRRMHDPLAERLAARGHRVISLDPLGHGDSDRPLEPWRYSMARCALQTVALLDHLGLERAVIGGTSQGANVALEAAVRSPERVAGLVLEMPVLDHGEEAVLAIFTATMFAMRYGAPAFRLAGAVARRMPLGRSALLDTGLVYAGQDPEATAAAIQGLNFGRTAPPVEERREIEAPALVIAHTLDPLHPLADAEAVAGEMPNARLLRARSILEMRFSPDRLAGQIADFLDETWTAREGRDPKPKRRTAAAARR